eukprot:15433947-Alexandrium_andersonii.AAC.1
MAVQSQSTQIPRTLREAQESTGNIRTARDSRVGAIAHLWPQHAQQGQPACSRGSRSATAGTLKFQHRALQAPRVAQHCGWLGHAQIQQWRKPFGSFGELLPRPPRVAFGLAGK